jgi:hypothetical protein
MFTSDYAREVYLEWEPEARAMLGRFRLAAARHPDDPRVNELIKKLRHPRLGPTEYSHVILQVADNTDHVIVTYSPAGQP